MSTSYQSKPVFQRLPVFAMLVVLWVFDLNIGPANAVDVFPGTFIDSGQILGAEASYDVAFADFDGDADLDAIVASSGAPGQVFFNDGKGVFVESKQALGVSGQNVVVGDLDGDADVDMVLASFNGPGVVWLNDGKGIFTDSGQTLGGTSGFIALGDLDNDDDLDAFVAHGFFGSIANHVWFNDGNGVFVDSGQMLGNADTTAVALGDLDKDGDLDALAANWGQPNRIWLNDGGGVFVDSGQVLLPT